MKKVFEFLLLFSILLSACGKKMPTVEDKGNEVNSLGQTVYQDVPYIQEYSVKYYLSKEQQNLKLKSISQDRNGNIRILSDKGLLMPENGNLFYSGKLTKDISYTPLESKNIASIITADRQTIYLDDQYIFSNAWAGKIQIEHKMPQANVFAKGSDFNFLVSDQNTLAFIDENGNKIWTSSYKDVINLIYDNTNNRFLIVSPNAITEFSKDQTINILLERNGITSAALFDGKVVVGTKEGYLFLSENKLIKNLPWPEITTVKEIYGELWFGSTKGTFKLNKNGKYSYFAGERWLPGNEVTALAEGKDNSVLILTDKGLGKIILQEMTLEAKAMFYEKQVREKNIRYGFNCSVSSLDNGYASAKMNHQPSDNLWTAMYLASQLYRYKVTESEEAKLNAYEAFEAMERLHTITNIDGLFARSFERDYIVVNTKKKGWEKTEIETGSPAKMWIQGADHENWTWRSTASSDQAVGQIFALTAVLELADDEDWKKRALKCLDDMMGYIVENDMYIIDIDGEPTLWGKWNPDYVNSFPTNVGDRRLYSSNIIAFLQTAYKFTGKEKYKEKAYELMEKDGYLENLLRPISKISPSDEDEWSKNLSHEWNHSDDEMYFLAYQGLYQYAFDNQLKEQYKASIKDHWMVERPEKNALWNFIYSQTGEKEIDLDASILYLKNYPMDLRNWAVHNSHRKDIELLPENFRNQTTKELLPLAELPLHRHNGDIFKLDKEGNGDQLISAGDVWLLPYWMGRYYGLISAPTENMNSKTNNM
ncbi:hypothetical protein [Chondrinema litorale]|uniref:hypothetical protein n=1 Tax=Chondrinema litorale TaxID=2994555 RepID=UPI002542FDD4|nr:hypothetical protein [Chondrinema litorale]UZR97234.1 hypothetical protein OQ292_25375 [Chondrinema litorale]